MTETNHQAGCMIQTDILIERWLNGDERAAEALYNRFRDSSFRLAYVLLGNKEDAEEAAHDALNYALSKIDRFRPEKASFKTWLNTITVSRCRDRQRRKRLPRIALSVWMQRGKDIPSREDNPEQAAARKEMRSEVWAAVQELKPAYKEAIYLRHWEGHTYREMSEIIGCPLPTAQSRVRLAHQQLRTLLSHSLAAGWEAPYTISNDLTE